MLIVKTKEHNKEKKTNICNNSIKNYKDVKWELMSQEQIISGTFICMTVWEIY